MPEPVDLQLVDWERPINHESPFARGLSGFWLGGSPGFKSRRWIDLSGRGNHGTLTNMNPVTDWVGVQNRHGFGGLDFSSGATEYVNVPQNAELFNVTSTNAVSGFVRFKTASDVSTRQRVIWHCDGDLEDGWAINFAFGGTNIQIWHDDPVGGRQIISGSVLTANTWYSVYFYIENGLRRLWLNGNLDINGTTSLADTTTVVDLAIGGELGSEGFKGVISQVLLWSGREELTQRQILDLSFNPAPPGLLNFAPVRNYYFAPAGGGSSVAVLDEGMLVGGLQPLAGGLC